MRTDETLMLAYAAGEASAFEALYARHRGRLFRYLLHQCGRREAADELFQEIWLSVIRASGGYEVSAKFTTWLYRIAHNRLIDHFRARGRAAEFEVEPTGGEDGEPDDRHDPPLPAHEQPERLFERAALAGRLVAAVEALPPLQRGAFLMAAEGGLSVEEIAAATGVGFETAKSRLRYAYSRLRRELQDLRESGEVA
jgi:RNA polymerase sigma-70 factor, ECF subfamily